MGKAAPATPASPHVQFLNAYAANPNAAVGKADPTRPLTPAEQVEAAQAAQSQGAAREAREQGPDVPQPPSLGPNEVPIRTIETHAARLPSLGAHLPTPGGITFVLLVVLLFWVFIIKVNGKSRFQWLWEVLTGNAVVAPGGPDATTIAVSAAQSLLTSEQNALQNTVTNPVAQVTATDLSNGTFQVTTPPGTGPFQFIVPSSQIAATSGAV